MVQRAVLFNWVACSCHSVTVARGKVPFHAGRQAAFQACPESFQARATCVTRGSLPQADLQALPLAALSALPQAPQPLPHNRSSLGCFRSPHLHARAAAGRAA